MAAYFNLYGMPLCLLFSLLLTVELAGIARRHYRAGLHLTAWKSALLIPCVWFVFTNTVLLANYHK